MTTSLLLLLPMLLGQNGGPHPAAEPPDGGVPTRGGEKAAVPLAPQSDSWPRSSRPGAGRGDRDGAAGAVERVGERGNTDAAQGGERPVPLARDAAAEKSSTAKDKASAAPIEKDDKGDKADAASATRNEIVALRAAQARAAELEWQVSELQAARQADQQRIEALQAQLADERSRREQAERSPAEREQALSSAANGLGQADQALASGSGDVSAALAQAQALAGDAAQRAGAGGSEQESLLAAEAQRWLAVSQEALRRGDLYQARVAVQAATRAAQQARALAGSAAAGSP